MNMKKLILFLALILTCAMVSYAQKTTYKFRDAQSRAGDAITEVCVKPTVVEVRLLIPEGKVKPERRTYQCDLSKEEAEIGMKGALLISVHTLLTWQMRITTAMLSWLPPTR